MNQVRIARIRIKVLYSIFLWTKIKSHVDFLLLKKDHLSLLHFKLCIIKLHLLFDTFWHCTTLLPHISTKEHLLLLFSAATPTYLPMKTWSTLGGEELQGGRKEYFERGWLTLIGFLICESTEGCINRCTMHNTSRWWLRLTLLHPISQIENKVVCGEAAKQKPWPDMRKTCGPWLGYSKTSPY